jgi:hypothetical protein
VDLSVVEHWMKSMMEAGREKKMDQGEVMEGRHRLGHEGPYVANLKSKIFQKSIESYGEV